MECPHCKVGALREPKDKHPSYLQCDTCNAIQLTYTPQDYQVEMHTHTNGEGKLDILAVFGKHNLPN